MAYYIYLEIYFEVPKMYTNQLNNICNGGVHFFLCNLPNICFSKVHFNIFAQICSVVTYKEIFKILRISVSQKTF